MSRIKAISNIVDAVFGWGALIICLTYALSGTAYAAAAADFERVETAFAVIGAVWVSAAIMRAIDWLDGREK